MPLCFHEQRGIPFYSLPEKEGLLFLHRIINRFLYPFTNVQLIQFTVGHVRINPVTQKDIDQLIHRVHPSTGPGKPSMTTSAGTPGAQFPFFESVISGLSNPKPRRLIFETSVVNS